MVAAPTREVGGLLRWSRFWQGAQTVVRESLSRTGVYATDSVHHRVYAGIVTCRSSARVHAGKMVNASGGDPLVSCIIIRRRYT